MKEHINILIGSDINYSPYYGIMLTSLLINNKDVQFDIFLLTDSTWTDKETRKYRDLIENYNSRFHVIVVDSSEMKEFPETTHISLPAYYRLKASSLLPSDVHKVLYLDGDIIVNGSLIPLWRTDIGGCAIAGVTDTIYYRDEVYDRLGYDKSFGYNNAGVALYNIDYWRENGVSDNAFHFIKQNKDKIKWMDQDVVNALLFDKKIGLPLRYNFQNRFLFKSEWDCFDDGFREEILKEMANPVIIHYCGPDKPWSFRYYRSPYSELYHYYRKQSCWAHARVCKPYLKYLKFLVKRIINHPSIEENLRQKYIQEALGLYKIQ